MTLRSYLIISHQYEIQLLYIEETHNFCSLVSETIYYERASIGIDSSN